MERMLEVWRENKNLNLDDLDIQVGDEAGQLEPLYVDGLTPHGILVSDFPIKALARAIIDIKSDPKLKKKQIIEQIYNCLYKQLPPPFALAFNRTFPSKWPFPAPICGNIHGHVGGVFDAPKEYENLDEVRTGQPKVEKGPVRTYSRRLSVISQSSERSTANKPSIQSKIISSNKEVGLSKNKDLTPSFMSKNKYRLLATVVGALLGAGIGVALSVTGIGAVVGLPLTVSSIAVLGGLVGLGVRVVKEKITAKRHVSMGQRLRTASDVKDAPVVTPATLTYNALINDLSNKSPPLSPSNPRTQVHPTPIKQVTGQASDDGIGGPPPSHVWLVGKNVAGVQSPDKRQPQADSQALTNRRFGFSCRCFGS